MADQEFEQNLEQLRIAAEAEAAKVREAVAWLKLSEHDRLHDLLAELDIDFFSFEHEPEGYATITIEPMRGEPVLHFDLKTGRFIGVFDDHIGKYYPTEREDIAR